MKKCSKCKVEKEDSAFAGDRQKPRGLASRCKECMNERYRLSRINGTYKPPPPKAKVPRKRKLIAGVGVNDADYKTTKTESYINDFGQRVKRTVWACPYFIRWTTMLHRVYTRLKDRPTYEGCSVSQDWLLFSNFKAWMETKQWDGLQLDKDILVEGNKIYSSETCAFVPHYLNVAVSLDRRSSDHEPGVYLIGKIFAAKMTVEGSSIEIGRYKTANEARAAYHNAKAVALENLLVRYRTEDFFDVAVEKAILNRIDNFKTGE